MHYRVVHTEWSNGWGGQERRVIAEMAGMRARGHHVLLATRVGCAIAGQARAAGIPVETVLFSGKFDIASILQLRKLIRRHEIGIVSTHSGVDSWVGAFAAKLSRVRLVRTRHLNLPLRRHWYNFVHFMADRIVSCGETMRRNLVDNCGFPAAQIVSIPTGIDFASFRPTRERAEMRRQLGLGDASYVILMAGIIRAVKRYELALRAFEKVLHDLPTAELVIAGDGPMRADMQALARSLRIEARVHFLGQREDVPDLMAAADVLLLTSRSEGVPQAVTQALGLGLPVVATRVGGVPELVIDEQTGLLVEAEDESAIVRSILRLACDPVLARRLGALGQEHALAHFSATAMLDATERLYADLLGSR